MQAERASITESGAHAAQVVDFGPSLSLLGVRIAFRRNEEIFGEGEIADYIYYIQSGAVRTMRFSHNGRRQILSFHMAGDVFGLEDSVRHAFSCEALTESQIVLVRRSQLDSATTENPDAARTLLALTARGMAEARDYALILGRKGAGERVAAFLLHIDARGRQQDELDLPMSRADIADHLVLTIETVSRAFTEMARQRAIALPTSRHVIVRSRAALLQLGAGKSEIVDAIAVDDERGAPTSGASNRAQNSPRRPQREAALESPRRN